MTVSSSNVAVARGVIEVTPHDVNRLANSVRALYVGTGGNVRVTSHNGSIATFKNVGSGSLLPVEVYLVHATGTTATDIVGLV